MRKRLIVTLLLCAMLLTALPLTALAQTYDYSDIAGQWFTDAATRYGYTEIFSNSSGRFNPNKKITRIEFVRMLHKALAIRINYFVAPDISQDFTDMKNSDIGSGELIDLVTTGIIEKGGPFNPAKQLDRDLMIHWVMNAINYATEGNYTVPKRVTIPFKDDMDIAETYKSDLYTAQLLSLIFGRGNNMFFPRDGATRAEAVTIVMRLITFVDSIKPRVAVTPFAWIGQDGTLNMSLTIVNGTDKPATIQHNSGQKFDFKLFDAAGNIIYTWSADKIFIAALTKTEIQPGENIVFQDSLDSSAVPVKTAVTMTAYITGKSSDFTIDENGYTASVVK